MRLNIMSQFHISEDPSLKEGKLFTDVYPRKDETKMKSQDCQIS